MTAGERATDITARHAEHLLRHACADCHDAADRIVEAEKHLPFILAAACSYSHRLGMQGIDSLPAWIVDLIPAASRGLSEQRPRDQFETMAARLVELEAENARLRAALTHRIAWSGSDCPCMGGEECLAFPDLRPVVDLPEGSVARDYALPLYRLEPQP